MHTHYGHMDLHLQEAHSWSVMCYNWWAYSLYKRVSMSSYTWFFIAQWGLPFVFMFLPLFQSSKHKTCHFVHSIDLSHTLLYETMSVTIDLILTCVSFLAPVLSFFLSFCPVLSSSSPLIFFFISLTFCYLLCFWDKVLLSCLSCLKFTIFLPWLSEWWDKRHVTPC